MSPAAGTLQALRAEFDGGFALAPQAAGAAHEKMLAIRAGEHAYALRLDQVAGLYADRRVVALPSPLPALLGVTGFRGQITPVYDLALLLGHARADAPRWLVLVRGALPLALAFDQFDSHFSVAPQQILGTAQALPQLSGTVFGAQQTRPIIHLPSLLDGIQRGADQAQRQRSVTP